MIEYHRDLDLSYFGFKTLERSYLLKIDGKVVERPQHMLMRVAIGIHKDDIEAAIEACEERRTRRRAIQLRAILVQSYNLMSEGCFIHATPTLFNAGTCKPQLSSCFLLTMKEDSMEGICKTLDRCATISKAAGGIGLNVHCIRARGSFIAGVS